jgi:hypothetical protein
MQPDSRIPAVEPASTAPLIPATLAAEVRAIRRRAAIDGVLVVTVTLAVAMPVSNAADSLAIGMAAVSIGILFFMLRRRKDFAVLARASRLREQALAGRGMSLADWAAGKPLAPWNERAMAPVQD